MKAVSPVVERNLNVFQPSLHVMGILTATMDQMKNDLNVAMVRIQLISSGQPRNETNT